MGVRNGTDCNADEPLDPTVKSAIDEIVRVSQANRQAVELQIGNLIREDFGWFMDCVRILPETERAAVLFVLVDRVRHLLVPLKVAVQHLAQNREQH